MTGNEARVGVQQIELTVDIKENIEHVIQKNSTTVFQVCFICVYKSALQ